MADMTVANEIRRQLGHQAFFMLGAKKLIGSENSLTFKIGRNPKSINYIKITLDPSDTYNVEFLRIRKPKNADVKRTTVAEFECVYVDTLHAVIERTTGMRLSLTRVYT